MSKIGHDVVSGRVNQKRKMSITERQRLINKINLMLQYVKKDSPEAERLKTMKRRLEERQLTERIARGTVRISSEQRKFLGWADSEGFKFEKKAFLSRDGDLYVKEVGHDKWQKVTEYGELGDRFYQKIPETAVEVNLE